MVSKDLEFGSAESSYCSYWTLASRGPECLALVENSSNLRGVQLLLLSKRTHRDATMLKNGMSRKIYRLCPSFSQLLLLQFLRLYTSGCGKNPFLRKEYKTGPLHILWAVFFMPLSELSSTKIKIHLDLLLARNIQQLLASLRKEVWCCFLAVVSDCAPPP